MVHLVVEENVILFKCLIQDNMTFGLNWYTNEVLQENGLFQCNMLFYIHNEHERTFVLKKYAHNIK